MNKKSSKERSMCNRVMSSVMLFVILPTVFLLWHCGSLRLSSFTCYKVKIYGGNNLALSNLKLQKNIFLGKICTFRVFQNLAGPSIRWRDLEAKIQ